MLYLSRRPDQAIVIGADVRIIVVSVRGNYVQLGIEAPKGVPIEREERLRPTSGEGEHDDPGPGTAGERPGSVS